MTTFATPNAAIPVIPVGYTIRVTVTRCNTCNYVSRQSEFLAMTLTKSRTGAGSPVKQWNPCVRPEYDLPIDRTFVNRMTPYCAECPNIDLSLLPVPPHASGLNVLPDMVIKGQPVKPKAAPAAAKPRIEDLA